MSRALLHRVDEGSELPNGSKQTRAESRAKSLSAEPQSKGGGKGKKGNKPKAKKRDTVAADLMQSPAISCGVHDTLHEAARRMWEHDVGAMVVVDETGRPVSMITDRDTCMAAYTQGVALYDGTVASAMAKTLVTCDEKAPVAEVRELMAAARVRRLPVVDGDGKLVGIVGLSDILAEANAALPKDRRRGTSAPMLLQLVDAILQKTEAG